MKRLMRAAMLSGVATCVLLSGGGVASAAQGGTDWNGTKSQHHSWMKVSKAELRNKTVDKACAELGLGSQCNNLVVLIVNQKYSNPNANGYWAEVYFTPYKSRSGTW